MKIAVIVDNIHPDQRRHCFWEEQLSSLPDLQIDLICLSNEMKARKFLNYHVYDVIIFNWDALNNDILFGADQSQAIVKLYRYPLTQYVREGGIIIIEDQTRFWHPVQDAYDCLFAGEIKVLSSTILDKEEPSWAAGCRINKRLREHPLVHNLNGVLHSEYARLPDFKWFPDNSVNLRTLQSLHASKVYSGAFKKWKREWLPLLYTDDEKYPIMLVKTDGYGLWVISTMFLASSNIPGLIENIVIKAKNNLPLINQYHSQYRRIRTLHALAGIAVILLIMGAVYGILALHIITLNLPFSNTLGGNFAISVLITIIIWVVSKVFDYVRSILRIALNK